MIECTICGKQVSNKGLAIHTRNSHTGTPWNKGLAKSDPRWVELSQRSKKNLHGACSKEYLGSPAHLEASSRGGGYRPGCGKGKKGWYKGYWCDSTWELAWIIYHLDQGVPFERCREEFSYDWKGKKRKYHPDFTKDNVHYEIKGYYNDMSKAKNEQVPQVVMLFKNDMQVFIDYARNKYEVSKLEELYDTGS